MDLAIEESAKQKEQTLKEMIPQELMTYWSIFNKITTNRFPDRRPWDHTINLPWFYSKKGTCLSVITTGTRKTWRICHGQLGKRLYTTIKVTTSVAILLRRKEGWRAKTSTRLLIATIKNAYPLLLISDLVDQLKGAKYFTKLDI